MKTAKFFVPKLQFFFVQPVNYSTLKREFFKICIYFLTDWSLIYELRAKHDQCHKTNLGDLVFM